VSGGGGGGGTNPGGGGGGTNSACGGGGGGETYVVVGVGATIGGGGGTEDGLDVPLPALSMGGTLALLSCPGVLIALTDSGGPVVVEMLEREPGPVRRVFWWMMASLRSLTSEMLLRFIRMSTIAVRLR
jgi:hypothetical protein